MVGLQILKRAHTAFNLQNLNALPPLLSCTIVIPRVFFHRWFFVLLASAECNLEHISGSLSKSRGFRRARKDGSSYVTCGPLSSVGVGRKQRPRWHSTCGPLP